MLLLLKIASSPLEALTIISFSEPLKAQACPLHRSLTQLPPNYAVPLKDKNKVIETR